MQLYFPSHDSRPRPRHCHHMSAARPVELREDGRQRRPTRLTLDGNFSCSGAVAKSIALSLPLTKGQIMMLILRRHKPRRTLGEDGGRKEGSAAPSPPPTSSHLLPSRHMGNTLSGDKTVEAAPPQIKSGGWMTAWNLFCFMRCN